jgi:hypothetical protein
VPRKQPTSHTFHVNATCGLAGGIAWWQLTVLLSQFDLKASIALGAVLG